MASLIEDLWPDAMDADAITLVCGPCLSLGGDPAIRFAVQIEKQTTTKSGRPGKPKRIITLTGTDRIELLESVLAALKGEIEGFEEHIRRGMA